MRQIIFPNALFVERMGMVLSLAILTTTVQINQSLFYPKDGANLATTEKAFEPPGDGYPDRTSGLGSRSDKQVPLQKSVT
ncbi:MAG: hypothetical protein AAF959_11380 [Cyanobacteria bacterium P01_D01_bin.56]